MIYVISGSPTVFLKGETSTLEPGDFMGFCPGRENVHYVANNTDAEVRLLVIASNPKGDAVIYGDA